jgi:hypothetical protein
LQFVVMSLNWLSLGLGCPSSPPPAARLGRGCRNALLHLEVHELLDGVRKSFGGQKIQLVPIGRFQLLLLLHRLAWIDQVLPAPRVTSQTRGSGASKVAQALHHLGIDTPCFGDGTAG